jgi:hypothetical protein
VIARTEVDKVTDKQQPTLDDAAVPDVHDIELATRAVRVHCPVMQYPATKRCLSCGWGFPCVTNRWGQNVLLAAGWSEREFTALDSRQGAWS